MATTRLSPIRPSPGRAREISVGSAGLGLGLAAGAAWLYLACMAWGMAHMDRGADMLIMPAMTHWNGADLALVFLMWVVMMAAMMLPSAAPMVQTFARTAGAPSPALSTFAFAVGYLAVWTGFSALATLGQWGLLELSLITPMMESASSWLSGGLLIAAGAFQFTRLKSACLNKCRSPLGFLMSEWRPGSGGAFIMGVHHGVYCAGCCALLMLLLFVLGVMNLAWIAVLTLIVLAEKALPAETLWPSRLLGAGLAVWGGYLLLITNG